MAISVEKVAANLLASGLEDWEVAKSLMGFGMQRHGLFLAHLAVEKLLKAHVTRVTETVPPRTHCLAELLQLAEVNLDDSLEETLLQLDTWDARDRCVEDIDAPVTEQRDGNRAMAASDRRPTLKQEVRDSVRNYLRAIEQDGIPVSFGVVFGSRVKGTEHEWSDIDLLVVSPKYDPQYDHADLVQLMHTATRTDWRIEPIPCGERAWIENDSSIIYEVARREGEKVYLT